MRSWLLLLLPVVATAACAPAVDNSPDVKSEPTDTSPDVDAADTAADTVDERADMDGDGFVEGDCAETDAAIHPGAAELCNGLDDDCDGTIDGGAVDARTWYADLDDDGYGDDMNPALACWKPEGHTLIPGDCDDGAPEVNPAGADWCDGVDDDCTGTEDDALDALEGFQDGDGDGFGFSPRQSCEPGPDFVDAGGDCDDGDPAAFPGADEWCNLDDDDCNGEVDDSARDALVWYADADGDSFGDAAARGWACSAPIGFVMDDGDCDDADAGTGGPIAWFEDTDGDGYGRAITWACAAPSLAVALGGDCDDAEGTAWPGAPEDCEATTDLNCDGIVGTADLDGDGERSCEDCDDSDPAVAGPDTWYADRDADGYGDGAQSIAACSAPAQFVAVGTDCNDASAVAWPGAPEVWYDDEDEDCLGGDDWDADLDGYAANVADCEDQLATVNPGEVERCANHLDDDCDGTDNGCAETGTASLSGAVLVVEGSPVDHVGTAWSAGLDFYGTGDSALVLGATGVDSGVNAGAGAVYVGSLLDLLADTTTPTWRATWTGEGVGHQGGGALSRVGDYDGDGEPDVVVGAQYHGSYGAVYLIPLATTGTNSLASASLRLDGFSGSTISDMDFGMDVVGIEDLDGNGADELVVVDWLADASYGETQRGCAYYFEGPLPAISDLRTGQLCGDLDNQRWSTADVVDLQGDGLPELVFTSQIAMGHTSGSGKVAFLELPFSGQLQTDAADFFLYGTSASNPIDISGQAGDVNDDGYADLHTGHSSDATHAYQAGAIHIYLGPMSASRDDDDADVWIHGTRDDEMASHAAAVGDIDDDGVDDLVVSGDAATVVDKAGRAALFYGPLAGTQTLDDASLILMGEAWGDAAGHAVIGPGDLDGDGFGDLLIGAPYYDADASGRAYLWLGTGG